MSYEKTKKFIIELAKKEVLYEIEFRKKQKYGDLSKQEEFCLNLFYFCKNLYENPCLVLDRYSMAKLGIMGYRDGLFFINQEFGKGSFCNANAMIESVYCEEKECHSTAYSFVSNFEGDVSIKSGIINPYHLDSGILHSICEFKRDNKTFVFDGANYLIMEKELYYKLYNFQCVQEIAKERLLKDVSAILKSSTKGLLKSGSVCKFIQDMSAVEKHFEGFGFMLYLYDRKTSMHLKGMGEQINKRNKEAMVELQNNVQMVEEQELNNKDKRYSETF